MKNWQNKLLFGLTGAFLAVGYSSLLATEAPLQNKPTFKQDFLAQAEKSKKVNEPSWEDSETYKYLKKQLDTAIEDAKKPSQDKVVNNLWPLSPTNPKIKVRNNNGKYEYLMVTWREERFIGTEWKSGAKVNIDRQTWLTAAPEVKEFCQNCKGTGIKPISGKSLLALRLQQYLGLVLNNSSNKTHFVEMWVKAEDLSRPCIDPEINDSTCKVLPVPVPDQYPVLQKIYTDSYAVGKQNYPWTGLGYTYDWANPNQPRQGASEFLINATKEKKVEVEIADVKVTQEYCNNQFLK